MLRKLTLLLLTFAFVPTAYASSITLNVDNGILMGARNVMVAGNPYNVEFVDGTCASVFGACDVEHFITNDGAMAMQFSRALLDQVFVDGPLGRFNTVPSLTFGCGPATPSRISAFCMVYTPFGILNAGTQFPEIRMYESIDSVITMDYDAVYYTLAGMSYDTSWIPTDSALSANVWARWSAPSQAVTTSQAVGVPEPSSLALLPIGIIGLMLVGRRTTPLSQ